jgi:hypothetical protein
MNLNLVTDKCITYMIIPIITTSRFCTVISNLLCFIGVVQRGEKEL